MKPVDAAEARRAAVRKGFRDEGGDHYYLYFFYEGRKTSWRIKVSRGADEYAASHIRKDARVCGDMPAVELRRVVTCENDGAWVVAEYQRRVIAQGG